MTAPVTRIVLDHRPMTKADLAELRAPRQAHVLTKLRDSHHQIARMFAAGMDVTQVADATGASYWRIRNLRATPAFEQLVAELRGMINSKWVEAFDPYTNVLAGNMIRAEMQIADRLAEAEDDPDSAGLSIKDLISISRDAASRLGYGTKSTQVNVNADFASLLDKAIARSRAPAAGPSPAVEGEGGETSPPLIPALTDAKQP